MAEGSGRSAGESDLVFYYCGVDTLMSIFTNRSIWLQDVSKSNDTMELNWGKEQITKQLEDECERWGDSVLGKARSGLVSEADFNTAVKRYMQVEDKTMRYVDKLLDSNICFAMCFSKNGDMLSQWRGYGSNGSGVSIGFDPGYLGWLCTVYDDSPLYRLTFDNVVYSKDGSMETPLTPEEVQIGFDQYLLPDDPSFTIEYSEFRDKVLHLLAFRKNKSFEEEAERRLAVWLSDGAPTASSWLMKASSSKDSQTTRARYTTKNGQLVLHLELPIHLDKAIKQIVLGPSCPMTTTDVERFLKSCLTTSSIPSVKESDSSYVSVGRQSPRRVDCF